LQFRETWIFTSIYHSKWLILLLLITSLVGVKGKKDEKVCTRTPIVMIVIGFTMFIFSQWIFFVQIESEIQALVYLICTSVGWLLILAGGARISRLIKVKLAQDVFNKQNETFPQEERLLENEYSINLPSQYILKGRVRRGHINIINPFRSLLVIGTPGAGKSYFVIRHVITQHISK